MAAVRGRVSFVRGCGPCKATHAPVGGGCFTCEHMGSNNWTQWVIETKWGAEERGDKERREKKTMVMKMKLGGGFEGDVSGP